MAAVSLLLLRLGMKRLSTTVEPHRIRMFKRQRGSVVLKVGSLGSSFATISSMSLVKPFGVQGEIGRFERGASEVTLTADYAGLFRGVKLAITITDALGLFVHPEEIDLGIAVESLPRSLLLPDIPLPVAPIVQGDVSTGGRGAGQELYSIEPYAPGADAKDVMWKRLARSEGDEMQVRVREASARAEVRILVAFGATEATVETKNTDLAAEAMAQLGKKLVSLGVKVELDYRQGRETSVAFATNPTELAVGLVDLWSSKVTRPSTDAGLSRADLLILDDAALKDERIAAMARVRPVLLLRGEGGGRASGGRLFVFSGEDDLTPLVEVLLEA